MANDDVIIPCNWTLTLNKPILTVKSLTIDGTLRFDTNQPKITIYADSIWVRAGSIVAGSADDPYLNKIEIVLTGNRNSKPVIIDDISATGTKSLAVIGQLALYGVFPATVWT